MVLKCCVPNCKGNYNRDNKVHVFKFPADEVMKQRWLHAIPRQNYTVTNYSVVSYYHYYYYYHFIIIIIIIISSSNNSIGTYSSICSNKVRPNTNVSLTCLILISYIEISKLKLHILLSTGMPQTFQKQ